MKLKIEVDELLDEPEIVIRCAGVDETVQKLQAMILSLSSPKILFYKGNQEFYLPLEKVLFFETEEERVFAHTANDTYLVKHRLYELESILPRYFVRAAKGTIVNISRITRSTAI